VKVKYPKLKKKTVIYLRKYRELNRAGECSGIAFDLHAETLDSNLRKTAALVIHVSINFPQFLQAKAGERKLRKAR
jgi:hypothetical protein